MREHHNARVRTCIPLKHVFECFCQLCAAGLVNTVRIYSHITQIDTVVRYERIVCEMMVYDGIVSKEGLRDYRPLRE